MKFYKAKFKFHNGAYGYQWMEIKTMAKSAKGLVKDIKNKYPEATQITIKELKMYK
jgi:hypothetical protein